MTAPSKAAAAVLNKGSIDGRLKFFSVHTANAAGPIPPRYERRGARRKSENFEVVRRPRHISL